MVIIPETWKPKTWKQGETVAKTRKEVAEFINNQLDTGAFRYGRVELRSLMDFLFDGPPAGSDEEIKR